MRKASVLLAGKVFEINGHDIRAVYETLAGLAADGRPKMIVADTVKGKGVFLHGESGEIPSCRTYPGAV